MLADYTKAESIENSCQGIISAVKSSSLNFGIQETPFSIYISVRKSYNKSSNPNLKSKQQNGAFYDVKSELDYLQTKIKHLENSNEILQRNYEETLNEAESITNQNCNLQNQLEILGDRLAESEEKIEATVDYKVKAIAFEKRALQTKHEKLAAELKDKRNEN